MLFRAFSVVLLILSLNFLWGSRPVNYILTTLIVFWLILSFRGMASMRSQVFGRVYWRGECTTIPLSPAPPPQVGRDQRYCVALTFDDGPTEPSTTQVLDILKRHDIKATFFIIGNNVAKYPELARRAHEEGHELANHTMSHPWMFRMKFSRIQEDIVLCQDEIEKAVGYRPRFFRQPVGLNNPSVMKIIDAMGMVMVGWQVRAYDAVKPDKEKIVRRILGGVRPGGIILLHDGWDGKTIPDRSATVAALEEIIPALKAKGYTFKTVSELISVENRQGAVKAGSLI